MFLDWNSDGWWNVNMKCIMSLTGLFRGVEVLTQSDSQVRARADLCLAEWHI